MTDENNQPQDQGAPATGSEETTSGATTAGADLGNETTGAAANAQDSGEPSAGPDATLSSSSDGASAAAGSTSTPDDSAAAAPAPAATPAPTPAPTQAPVAAPASSISQKVAAVVEAAKPEVTTLGLLQLQAVQVYVDAMQPNRPMGSDEGARHQQTLYRAVTTIINQCDADFDAAFSALLKILVIGQDDVFHEHNVFRFTEALPMPEDDRKTFLTLVHFLKLMAHPGGRSHARGQLNLPKVFGPSINAQGRARVSGYFDL